jgi:hypothetical protein
MKNGVNIVVNYCSEFNHWIVNHDGNVVNYPVVNGALRSEGGIDGSARWSYEWSVVS